MARSAPPTFKTKLDRLYPRQDAPTQLALDYSPEQAAGLTLASLPTSFLGGLRKPATPRPPSATFPCRAG
jgi:hypothetical protein